MTFTISLPGGPRDFEFEAYIRLLEKNGVNVANTPRVLDPITQKRWLPAWSNEAEAQAFAAALRQETKNDNWTIYSTPNIQLSSGPLGPIDILMSGRSDGCTYSLSPTSRKLILKMFPQANLVPNVFISTTTPSDCEQIHRPIWGQIALILTGLSEKQIQQLGGYRIVDPRGKRILREAALAHESLLRTAIPQ